MNTFIAAGGKLVEGGMALVHGLSEGNHMNGMIVVTERLVIDGERYKAGILSIGCEVVWLCAGENMAIKVNGSLRPSEHAFLLAKNLTPIKPEAEPKLITFERWVLA